MKKTSFITVLILIKSSLLFSQVAVNMEGTPPDTSSMLDIQNDTKGVLIPRMALEQIVAIYRPAKGLMAYNTNDNHIYINRGSKMSPNWAMVNTEWGINGSNIFFLGSNVGIGTPSPGTKLDIRGNSPDDGIALQVGNGDLSHRLLLYGGRQNDPDPFIQWKQDDKLRFMTDQGGGSEKMRITGDGKVGIGTTTPSANLHVAKTGPGYTGLFGIPISTYNSGTNVSIGDTNQSAVLYVGQNEYDKGFVTWNYASDPSQAYLGIGTYGGLHSLILQQAGGDVGIGTDWPAARLDVEYDESNFSKIGYNDEWCNYFYHVDQTDDDGQATLYAFRASDGNDGVGYALSFSNYSILANNWWPDQYSFGVAGYVGNYSGTRNGGVFGSDEWATYWGSLAYATSGGTLYGGYFTSSAIGPGKGSHPPGTGIGLGAWGDLLGADIHGKVYGLYVEGENYAMYSHGIVFKDDLDVHLQDNGTGTNTALYTYVSTDVCVQTCGVATLSDGRASIVFDPAFTAGVSSELPVVVTVTPMGKSNGIYLSDVSGNGFTVVENNDGKSNVTINYIAIGRRIGYENPSLPAEVVDAAYTGKIAKGLHNDADTKTNGEGLYYENGALVVGVHPSALPDPDKASRVTAIPEPAKHPERLMNDEGKGLIGN